MKRALWILITLTALISLGVVAQRWIVEYPNRTVELVYDLPGLVEFSQRSGRPLERLLLDLKNAGVKTIAVQPENVGEALLRRKILPDAVSEVLPRQALELGRFLTLPTTFLEEELELVRVAGMSAAPKLNVSPWQLEPLWLAESPNLLIISGQGVLEDGAMYGSQARLALVEFSTPKLQTVDTNRLVRLHGISAPEMRVLSDERIINRYVRAVRERNIRVLYIRPFVEGENPWERSLELLTTLKTRLLQAGFQLGEAEPFSPWTTSRLALTLTGVGIWAAATVYGIGLFSKPTLIASGGLLGWLGTLGLIVKAPTLAGQGLALLAAIIFPSLAIQLLWGKNSFQRYWGTAAVSLLGALFVVASLTGTEYLVKLQEFRGVKVMHVLPIALVFFSLARPLLPWLKKHVPMLYLIWAGALGLVGVVYILRTGNFGIPVFRFEVQTREFLENLLRTRPRTKELFVGHPALYLALQGEKPQKSWLLPIAVIGQISLVNTFTHTHTMLWVSLLRTAYGLVFGYLIGWLAGKIYFWGTRWLRRDSGLGLLRVR